MVLASTMECNPNHGTNDTEKAWMGDLLAAAAVLAAGYNSVRAVDLATKEWNMAKKYWRIAQNWLDYYRDYYAPVEDQEIAEALALVDEQPEYEVARGRARVAAMLEFRDMLQKTLRCQSVYCTGLRQDILVELTTAQANAIAMADGLGYRNERAYIETRSDVRFEKQLNTAKRGRDMVASNVSLAKAAANIYGDLYEQAWEGLVGAGQYLGYWSSRHNTAYPTTFTAGRAQQLSKAKGADVVADISGAVSNAAGG